MNFNEHYELRDRHAFLSASKYHWTNYTDEKLVQTYLNHQAAEYGTRLHAYACESIKLGIKQARTQKTLNMFINDAIGFRLTPEQPLFYSINCFGTADAIGFRKNFLRVHDYKSGVSPASPVQLEIYAALFCLEYSKNPHDIGMELRIYQSNDIVFHHPTPDRIVSLMNTIIDFDKKIEELKIGA